MANTIGFGRNIGSTPDKLTDEEWSSFRDDVLRAVHESGGEVIFVGTGDGIWQGVREEAACVVFLGGNASSLLDRLSTLAIRYRQDSIAITEGETEFIQARAITRRR